MPSSSSFLRRLVLCVLAVLFLTDPALGAVGRWTPFGPPTGEIQEMLADLTMPHFLYALTPSGVYRSTDDGLTWGWSGAGLPRGITALALDPQHPGTLWAAGNVSVFRSKDRGVHWKRVSGEGFQPFPPPPGLTAGRVLLTVVPGNPGALLYAGHAFLGLWRSGNGGRTWSAVPGPSEIVSLKADSAGRVYAVQVDGILWRSDDAGLRWQSLDAIPGFSDLAVSSGRRSVLFATTVRALLRSRNLGASWQTVLAAPEEGSIGALALDPQRPETVYVAAYLGEAPHVWISENTGASWRQTPGPPPVEMLRLLVEPARQRIFAISHWDLASSRDRGRTWTQAGVAGRVPAFDSLLRFDPTDPSRIFAVTGYRLFLSRDGGRTWRHLPVRAPEWDPDVVAEVADLTFDPNRPRFLFAIAAGRVLLSRDDGLTWTALPLLGGGFERIAFPSRSNLVVAGWGLFRSADRGQTWTETLSGDVSTDVFRVCNRLAADPTNPQRLFARCHLVLYSDGEPTSYGTAMWRSLDGGWSWTELPGFWGVAFDPVDPETVYGWTRDPNTLVRSEDGGVTWEQVGEPIDHVWADLLVDPRAPEILYAAGAYPLEIERSRDGGVTWESLQAGFQGVTTWADSLWAHPTIPHQIYLGVGGGAFYAARFPEE